VLAGTAAGGGSHHGVRFLIPGRNLFGIARMIAASGLAPSGGPSFLIVEVGVSSIAFAVAVCWPGVGRTWLSKAEQFFGRLARRRGLSVLAVGTAALILRLAILPWSPVPQPFIHDEFANLLAADTFASGRLTNPTHPMWPYFESFHITQQPTYMSMYFPAQGLVLAAGKVLAGHPWFGVWFSVGLMCSAICWMLEAWLPPGWALLGGALAVMRLALFSYWVDSYYGGAVAAIGGALVLGALPRVMRTARIRDGFLMALGVAILANSRPYEGLLLSVPVAGALLWWACTKTRPAAAVLLRRAMAPAALLLVVAGMSAYYNYRVFGNPLTLPYQVNRATYASAPVFLWQQPRPEPVYRHRVMREFYSKWEMGDFLYARTLTGFLHDTAQKLGIVLFFFFGIALLPPLILLPRVFRDRRTRFLLAAGAFYGVGLSVNAWLFPHYLAPFTCALYAILLQAMRHLRRWRPGNQPSGLALVRIIPVVCLLLVGLRLCSGPLHLSIPRWPTMWYGTAPLGLPRAQVVAQLEAYVGPQLAIVRYASHHRPFDDWVYNAADIDNSRVVWAREMESRSSPELLRYFHDRRAWLVEPDCHPPAISPYPQRTPPVQVPVEADNGSSSSSGPLMRRCR
jgi:hypothetical protein